MRKLCTRRLNHYETDADGVCHFSNYFRHTEEALFEVVEPQIWSSLQEQNHTLAIVGANATYMNSLTFLEQFSVYLKTSQLRRTRAMLEFLIADDTAKTEYCSVSLTVVCIDKSNNEVVKLPTELVEKLQEMTRD
ncbi:MULTISPECIES: acyl-CoA thioesterase [Pseudoalteromonas]|uniref:Thioesterase n=1 Tax=Pseudoalteromonas amylolytica TaxID=1859457 RepID=A0A1S1MMW0_9GAMM|nr:MULTISPECIES: thioesterase family protein [Pseudoalteromonas]MCF6436502.1 thioesterase family protein [Pseudoalteromonas sp. MMG022]OHU86150.1 hypothetical protein BFC16_15685 [Pseudoalteromonas sp. JW3]OHU89743.1 hypothetical protein BET10_16630 [Pseudoalteromonas amylolytica]